MRLGRISDRKYPPSLDSMVSEAALGGLETARKRTRTRPALTAVGNFDLSRHGFKR